VGVGVGEYPPMIKKSVEELRNQDEDPLERDDTNFDTHRQLLTTAADMNFGVEDPGRPRSLMIKTDEKVKKKKRKKDKKSKKKKKAKNKEDSRLSHTAGLQKKATIIVSKKIVRQATANNMTLGQFIRENKLRLVDPSKDDLRRVGSRRSSTNKTTATRRSSKGSYYKSNKDNYEEDKNDGFDSHRERNPQIRSVSQPMKIYKRNGSVEYNDLFDNEMRKKINKQIKRSTTQNLIAKKLEHPKKMRVKKPEPLKPKVPSRNMTLNDIMIFIFLVVLTLFGVILSGIEFSYYADSV
jgi:hypothetical protein